MNVKTIRCLSMIPNVVKSIFLIYLLINSQLIT
jgi:hypothetical protein